MASAEKIPIAQAQAAFLRGTLTGWLPLGLEKEAANYKHLQTLLRRINGFLSENGQAGIPIEQYLITPSTFSEKLVQFLNEMHHSANPLNDKSEQQEPEAVARRHQRLADLYDMITAYLDSTETPVNRHGAILAKNSANTQLKIWKRTVSIDADGEHHVRTVAADAIDFSKKAIICCGGTAAMDQNVDGFLDLAEAKLGGAGIYDKGMELYALSYPLAHRSAFFADTHRYNANPETQVSENAGKFIDAYLRPQLEQIMPSDPQALKAFFSKLNFFTYSYGPVFVQEVRNGLEALLSKQGYRPADIKEAFAEAYAMHIGPCCRLDVERPNGNFSAIYVMSPEDLSVRSKSDNWRLLESFAPGERAKSLSENEIIIYSDLPLEGRFLQETPACMDATNAMEASRYRTHRNPSGHGMRFYMQPTLKELTMHVPDYFEYCLRDLLNPDAVAAPEGQFTALAKPKLSGHRQAIDKLARQAQLTGQKF